MLVYNRNSLIAKPLKIWSIIILAGIVFKFNNWPGSSVMVLCGFSGITAYSISSSFKPKSKSILNNIVVGLGLGWLLFIIYGAFFNDGYPYNKIALIIYSITFTFSFFIYLLLMVSRSVNNYRTEKPKLLLNLLDVNKAINTIIIFFISAQVALAIVELSNSSDPSKNHKQDLVLEHEYYFLSNGTTKIYRVDEKYTAKVYMNDNSLYSKQDFKMKMKFKLGRYNGYSSFDKYIKVKGDTGYVEFKVNGDSVQIGEEKVKYWSILATISLPEKDYSFAMTQAFIVKK